HLVLEFRDDALGHFRPDARRARHHRLVARLDRRRKLGRLERAEHGERHLGADALYRLQDAEPFALGVAGKAEQLDLVLAHIGLDRQRRRLARRRQRLQRARRAVHQIADAVDVEDDVVLAVRVDDALELADHRAATFNFAAITTLPRWCAWHTAMASASAASSDCGDAFGSSTPIIMRICALSPCPAPTTVFLTTLGAYSATDSPARAGTSMATPRAWPSFSVDAPLALTKVCSTAASCGAWVSMMRMSPSWIATS